MNLQILQEEIPTIVVADSKFLGFTRIISSKAEAFLYQQSLKKKYSSAAHIPFCYVFEEENDDYDGASSNDNLKRDIIGNIGLDEDGEPENSCGEFLLNETKLHFNKYMMCNDSNSDNNNNNADHDYYYDDNDDDYNNNNENNNNHRNRKSSKRNTDKKGLVLVIVRFFGERLLGVTCGRLSQCYQSIALLTLHRFFHGKDVGLQQDFTNGLIETSKYGMGAGDCEVILNVISNIHGSDDVKLFPKKLFNELDFGGFRGNKGEELPRLQNLQANVSNGTIPVYRYPGNYRGDEWNTYEWSKTSLQVKDAVEQHLKPLYKQEMNHCVSNFYRDGNDFIDHHSDKDLDLDKDGVIVSVSLGDERVLELKRRSMPKDVIRIRLPHGSMLVLGPYTNKLFTHSILKNEESNVPRMSLTFRYVVTFMDLKTRRLFGEGVSSSTQKQMRNAQRMESAAFVIGFSGIAFLFNQRDKSTGPLVHKSWIKTCISTAGVFTLSFIPFRNLSLKICKNKEERQARGFFSKASIHGTKY